jgi:hypothetical protein
VLVVGTSRVAGIFTNLLTTELTLGPQSEHKPIADFGSFLNLISVNAKVQSLVFASCCVAKLI